MLTISTTTDHYSEVSNIIKTVPRLDELVRVVDLMGDVLPTTLLVENHTLKIALDWNDNAPPYLIPPMSLSKANLLAIIFYKLGNYAEIEKYVPTESTLYRHLLIPIYIQAGHEITESMLELANENEHNRCIVQHYGNCPVAWSNVELETAYRKALANSPNDEFKIFTAKQYLNFLIDTDNLEAAETVIEKLKPQAISDDAVNSLRVLSATLKIHQIRRPYNSAQLAQILDLLTTSIRFYEQRTETDQAGILLLEAGQIANFQKDFSHSKKLLDRAIKYFKASDLQEFLAQALFKKGRLLYSWSKHDSPQYYKPAINTFQECLKFFKQADFPAEFAEVHHNLALIYAEMPATPEERAIWAAFAAASFQHALNFYIKAAYPYEYAMISHNYATALLDFPKAKLSDNLTKANQLFEEALTIRTPAKYPTERALTLANQLKLLWLLPNENRAAEQQRFEQMRGNIAEIKSLVKDETILEWAEASLRDVEKLERDLKLS